MASLTFVSLYAGAGGLDLGFVMAGFTPVWVNDLDPSAVASYRVIFSGIVREHEITCGDIRYQRMPERDSADLVIGGPPCQGFSIAGKMDPNDPRSRHVWDFMGVVRLVRPKAFVMENVKSLALSVRWHTVISSLREAGEALGYRTKILVLNSAHFGVPQLRERMFLIGTRDGAEVRPEPTTSTALPSVRTALESLPPFGTPGNDSVCRAKIVPARKPVLRRSAYAGMLFNGQGRPLNVDRPALTLPASMGGNRTPIIDQVQLVKGGESWVVKYHRHLMKRRTPLTAAPGRLRRITVEEAAAIQTFPKGIQWVGTQTAAYRQIGNAVPPALAFSVATALREAMTKRPRMPKRVAVPHPIGSTRSDGR